MNATWPSYAGWLLHSAVGGGLLLLLAWPLMKACRQPARRQRLGEIALLAALLSCALNLGPSWIKVQLLTLDPSSAVASSSESSSGPGQPEVGAAIAKENISASAGVAGRLRDDPAALEEGDAILAILASGDNLPTRDSSPEIVLPPSKAAGSAPAIVSGLGTLRLSQWLMLVALPYAAVSVFLLGRWLLGHFLLWRLLRAAHPAPGPVDHLFKTMLRERWPQPRLLVSSHLRVPLSCGLIRPCVVVPASLCEPKAAGTLRWVFAHELTHLARGDAWACLLFGLGQVLYFFLPWFWWLRRQVRLCQEYIADAAAAEQAADPEDYAQFLVSLTRAPALPLGALGVFGNSSDLLRRVTMLLQSPIRVEKRCPGWWSLATAGGLLGLALLVSGIGLHADEAAGPTGKESVTETPRPPQRPEQGNSAEGEQAAEKVADHVLNNAEEAEKKRGLPWDYECLYVRARDAEKMLKDLLGVSAPAGGAQMKTVYVSCDDRSNKIFVSGPPDKIEQAKRIMERFDIPQRVPNRPVVNGPPTLGPNQNEKKIQLKIRKMPFTEALEWLAHQTDLPVVASVKPEGNFEFTPPGDKTREYTIAEIVDIFNASLMTSPKPCLLIRGPRQFTLIPLPVNGPPTRQTHRAQAGNAESLAKALQELYKGREANITAIGKDQIMVWALPEDQIAIGKYIAGSKDESITELIKLNNLEAAKMLDSLKALFDNKSGAAVSTLAADPAQNVIIVKGTAEQIKQVRDTLVALGEEPDTGQGPPKTQRIITLEKGNAATLAQALARMLPQIRGNPVQIIVRGAGDNGPAYRGPQANKPANDNRPGDEKASITLTAFGNKLIASCDDPQALNLVQDLSRLLTTGGGGDFEVIKLKTAHAVDAAKVIEQAFDHKGHVRVVADPATNSLLVQASPLDMLTIRNIVEEYVDGDKGEAQRKPRNEGRLGIEVQKPSPALADQLDLPKGQGLLVEHVVPGSAAAKAGLKAHDILLEFNGKPVPNEVAEFVKIVEEVKANTPVDAVVLRKGKKETVKGLSLPEIKARRGFQFRGPTGAPLPQLPHGLPPLNRPNAQLMWQFGWPDKHSVMTTMFRSKDGFNTRYQEGSLVITVTGSVTDGKSKVKQIEIQDSGKSETYESADKVPEQYRDKVKNLIEMSEKNNLKIEIGENLQEGNDKTVVKTWKLGPFQHAHAKDVYRLIKDVYREHLNNQLSLMEKGVLRNSFLYGMGKRNTDQSGQPRGVDLSVTYDEQTNTVFLNCNQIMYEEIDKLIKDYDQDAKKGPGPRR